MNSFTRSVKSLLTQKVPRSGVSGDQKIVVSHYMKMVDDFIDKVVVPLSEDSKDSNDGDSTDPVSYLNSGGNKGFTIEAVPAYFAVYRQGVILLSEKKQPDISQPIVVNQEAVDKLVTYFDKLPIENYFELSQTFIQNSFIVISSWYKELSMKRLVKNIYSQHPPTEWYDLVKNDKTVVPDNVADIIQRMQIYLGANSV